MDSSSSDLAESGMSLPEEKSSSNATATSDDGSDMANDGLDESHDHDDWPALKKELRRCYLKIHHHEEVVREASETCVCDVCSANMTDLDYVVSNITDDFETDFVDVSFIIMYM